MAGFRFRFQKVMDMKQNEKEQAKAEYAGFLLQITQKEQELEGIQDLKRQWEEKWLGFQNQSVSIHTLLDTQVYIQHLENQIRIKKQELGFIEQQADEYQQRLIEKTKEVQVWETWKDKKALEYQEEFNQLEQKLMDELGLQRYIRKGGE